MEVRPRLCWFAVCLVLAGIAGPVTAQLDASVASVEPCGKSPTGAIVTIKVANRGPTATEPLVFECTPKSGSPTILRRVPSPYVDRVGRPVPIGGSQTYAMLTTADPGLFTGARVRVIQSAPCAAMPPAAPFVTLGTPSSGKRNHERGGTFEFATLPIQNLRESPVDVTIRATFDKPVGATVLIHRRLKPKEQAQATFNDLPLAVVPAIAAGTDDIVMDFVVPRGAHITSAKVVDWCAVEAGDPAVPTALLRDAYASWVRWDQPLGVTCRYTATLRAGASTREVVGRFGISAAGAIDVRPDAPPLPDDPARIGATLQAAFADLPRPSVDDAMKLCTPKLIENGPPAVVECTGKTWRGQFENTRFAIADRRIVGHNWLGGTPDDLHVEWTPEPFEGGYVIAERRAFNLSGQGKPTEVTRWRYARVDGVVMPTRILRTETALAGTEPWSVDIRLSELKVDAAAAAPIASPAADAVRAAWNAGYRHPKEAANFTCQFVVRTGKDGLWRGVKSVKGKLQVTGFSGGQWGKVDVTVEGVADESLRTSLASAVDDRLGLWSGRDFASRADFDRTFAGAAFSERGDSPGTFDINRGNYRSVTLKDGRVTSLTFTSGVVRTFTWTKIGDDMAVTRVVTGPEDLTAEFTRLGAWLVPTHMNYKGVFGDESTWGTEEVTLTGLARR